MKFILFDKLSTLSTWQWILIAFFAILATFATIYIVRSNPLTSNNQKVHSSVIRSKNINALVYGALCIALSFVLSYIRLFKMPQGGSITLASMLPIMLYANQFGVKHGFLAALCCSFLQFIQDPYFLSFPQFMLDYVLGFGALGLAALFKKHLITGVFVAGTARLFFSFLSGVLFFGEYAAAAGLSSIIYSLTYQLSSIGIDTVICALAAYLLSKHSLFSRFQSKQQV